MADSARSFFTPPALSLPKGGGAISGMGEKFSTNPATGSGSLTIPIFTSPSRSGFDPQLSLGYDSSAGNGPFGLGWTLSLPSVSRKTDKGVPRYLGGPAGEDIFVLSGAEDLVPVLVDGSDGWTRDEEVRDGVTITRYRPRVESPFARIERHRRLVDGDTCWRVISRDNVTSWYGRTQASRIADPADPRQVFTWLVCESIDDRGNAIVYEYVPEDSAGVDPSSPDERNRTAGGRSANRYLKRIRYGNTTSHLAEPDLDQLAWMFEVVFDYGEDHIASRPVDAEEREIVDVSFAAARAWPRRLDPFSRYRAGFEVRTYRLCRRVLMFHHFAAELGTADCLVRSTEFGYAEGTLASYVTSVQRSHYRRRDDGSYLKASFPPLSLEYSPITLDTTVRTLAARSLDDLPPGIDRRRCQWLDLDGEGAPGLLLSEPGGWYFKRNLSAATFVEKAGRRHTDARFGPLTPLVSLPATGGAPVFMDLAGNGTLDCAIFESPAPGFYERTLDDEWAPFRPLVSNPNIDWGDPNVRLIDVDGDGLADVLISEDDVFVCHPSRGPDGFDRARWTPRSVDEELGPAVVFADSTRTIHLADMSGDGLSDIVRISNGEVCYWPNLGHGRFGRKVTMAGAPVFAPPGEFDGARLRLADIDGSGVTDIVYLGREGVALYFNQAGNSWSQPRVLNLSTPDPSTEVSALDLLGIGTACLVWSSELADAPDRTVTYVDLMGSTKPHLLVGCANNLGAETRLFYSPSTRFLQLDRAAGRPWLTRLPFPVHVVDRVETYDFVSRNRFVTRYSYHHGYYDGVEREFRGFGRVDRFDTEELGALNDASPFPAAENVDAVSYVPTLETRTWFHTGAHGSDAAISTQYGGEYYREEHEGLPSPSDEQRAAMSLPDTDVTDVPLDHRTEACRALKGVMLREEVYGRDDSEAARRPYRISECNFTVRCLQPRGPNTHAVFLTHQRELVEMQYERRLYPEAAPVVADPRVSHRLTLAFDEYGNELRSASVAYGRRRDDDSGRLSAEDKRRQQALHMTVTESIYTEPILEDNAYRAPTAADVATFELVQARPQRTVADTTNLFLFQEVERHVADAATPGHTLDYDDVDGVHVVDTLAHRRPIEQVRTLFRTDDLSNALTLGRSGIRALPFSVLTLALTQRLLTLYRRSGTDLLPASPSSVLETEGGYISGDALTTSGLFPATDPAGQWWAPSGRLWYSEDPAHTPTQELAAAVTHFFQPRRFEDPFGHHTHLHFDVYDLLPLEVEDAAGNRTTAGRRGTSGIVNGYDYRLLSPRTITDPNDNPSEVAYDTLGFVVGTALKDKAGEVSGDSLDDFVADLTRSQRDAFLAFPRGPSATALLAGASSRIVYDLTAYLRNPPAAGPVCAATIAREAHRGDPDGTGAIQVSVSYSDGFGREIQRRVQAEPGPLDPGGPMAIPRWAVTGWSVFNNKGLPVRQYEPFFDDTHAFTFAPARGVSSIAFYDPAGRVVFTVHPNHTWEKVVFEPWHQESWDVHDTVADDPRSHGDIVPFLVYNDGTPRLSEADFLPTWHALRTDPAYATQAALEWPDAHLRDVEKEAAEKASVHARTPTRVYTDGLGRTFLTIAHNKWQYAAGGVAEAHYASRTAFDIEGNERRVIDAMGRTVMACNYDMRGTRIHHASMESGARWVLSDVAGIPTRAWEERGVDRRMTYDALRRPLAVFITESGTERKAEQIDYGESQGSAGNHRTRVYRSFDDAGIVTSDAYDFKGNLLHSSRMLLPFSTQAVDWSASPVASEGPFSTRRTFDALNRVRTMTTPDLSIYRQRYNEAGLAEAIDVRRRGAGLFEPCVTSTDYNARGQRLSVTYGNGARTACDYDRRTFRLTRLATTRPGGTDITVSQIFSSGSPVQDLRYTYDAAGNIATLQDAALATVIRAGETVAPVSQYTYDAVFRLIEAEAREHIGQSALDLDPPAGNRRDLPTFGARALPADLRALRRFRERYEYDAAGNFLKVVHSAAGGGWTRDYAYGEPNPLGPPGVPNNRLTRTTVGTFVETYGYTDAAGRDANGAVTSINAMTMGWDADEQLTTVRLGGGGTAHYVYDSEDQRVRRVIVRADGTRKEERLYFGAFEIYRRYNGSGTAIDVERETLHVMDGGERVAILEIQTIAGGSPVTTAAPVSRYQLSNHLGSSCLELDEQATLISYEEYYPFGATAFQVGTAAGGELSAKRYRYTGKERDEETGFSYHGSRYYAPWIGRWTSCDPKGLPAGLNLYLYVRGNPVRCMDPDGATEIEGKQAANRVDRFLNIVAGPGAIVLRPLADAVGEVAVTTYHDPNAGMAMAMELFKQAALSSLPGVGTAMAIRAGDKEMTAAVREAGLAGKEGKWAEATGHALDAGFTIVETAAVVVGDALVHSHSPRTSHAPRSHSQPSPVRPFGEVRQNAPAATARPGATHTGVTDSSQPGGKAAPAGSVQDLGNGPGKSISTPPPFSSQKPDVFLGALRRWKITPTQGSRGVTPTIRKEVRAWAAKYGTVDGPPTTDPVHAGHTFGRSHVFTPNDATTSVAAETPRENLRKASAEAAAAEFRRKYNTANPDRPQLFARPRGRP